MSSLLSPPLFTHRFLVMHILFLSLSSRLGKEICLVCLCFNEIFWLPKKKKFLVFQPTYLKKNTLLPISLYFTSHNIVTSALASISITIYFLIFFFISLIFNLHLKIFTIHIRSRKKGLKSLDLTSQFMKIHKPHIVPTLKRETNPFSIWLLHISKLLFCTHSLHKTVQKFILRVSIQYLSL